jgi:hypothetical protein
MWVTWNRVYGNDRQLQQWLEAQPQAWAGSSGR